MVHCTFLLVSLAEILKLLIVVIMESKSRWFLDNILTVRMAVPDPCRISNPGPKKCILV